jgi:large subunit ribosomal protein L22
MQSIAKGKYVNSSAQKARLVLDQIRGKGVGEALAILSVTRKKAARDIEKILKSAIANAANREENPADADTLFVARTFADGASLAYRKRYAARAQGRGVRIARRQSHVTIELDSRKGK